MVLKFILNVEKIVVKCPNWPNRTLGWFHANIQDLLKRTRTGQAWNWHVKCGLLAKIPSWLLEDCASHDLRDVSHGTSVLSLCYHTHKEFTPFLISFFNSKRFYFWYFFHFSCRFVLFVDKIAKMRLTESRKDVKTKSRNLLRRL